MCKLVQNKAITMRLKLLCLAMGAGTQREHTIAEFNKAVDEALSLAKGIKEAEAEIEYLKKTCV